MDLESLRKEIDEADRELLRLFLRRMSISEEIARYKIENSLPVFHPGREAEILQWARENGGNLGGFAADFFAALMDISKRRQSQLVSDSHRLD